MKLKPLLILKLKLLLILKLKPLPDLEIKTPANFEIKVLTNFKIKTPANFEMKTSANFEIETPENYIFHANIYTYIDYMNRLSKNKNKRNISWIIDNNNEKILNMTYITKTIKSMMSNYQFIFLNERLDTCLVLLKFLLNLNINDIIYLSSKVSSSGGDASYYTSYAKLVY